MPTSHRSAVHVTVLLRVLGPSVRERSSADSPKHSFAANGNSSSEPRRLHTTFPSLMK